MYCKNCGQPLGDNEKVCKNCGEDMSLGHQAFESAKDVFQSAEKQIDDAVNEFTGKKPSGEKERLQEQVNQLGLSDSVTLTGPLERTKINEIYKNCHAFVLASESETFGVSYIEALYAGLPVVATRCGGPESFVNESNGTLVAVNDVQAIAKGLRRIRENYDSYDSRKISADCIARFSPSSIAKALEKVYQSVMEKASAQ